MSRLERSRRRLAVRAFVRLVLGFAILLAVLLLSAGTVAYWQAWTYMAVLFVPMILALVFLLKNDPELLERRLRTKEKSPEQSFLVKLGSVFYGIAFLLPGFDRRFDWSHVSVSVVVVADVFVLLGYGLCLLVLRENRYASRVVEVEEGQHVITTGPYAILRHPMYLGVLLMFLFTPVALGSWWAQICFLPLLAVLIARIRKEEELLTKELKGYLEYTETTRYRLFPGVW